MFSSRFIRSLCALLFLSLAHSSTAEAYEAFFTHRWITRVAAQHVLRNHPGQYPELQEYIEKLVEGAEHEDDIFLDGDQDALTLRVQRHFYQPVSKRGLEMEGEVFPSSFAWATLSGGQNEWDWNAALDSFAKGDIETSLFNLGHVVHLVQDLTVPAHTHLDIHGPPFGDDYEQYCFWQMTDQYTSTLPAPPSDAPIPEFLDLDEVWQVTAMASYWRNMYGGDLSDIEAADGQIALMFDTLEWSYFSEVWAIDDPPIGDMFEDFWEEEPGYYYFKNTEFPANFDRVDFSVVDPTNVEVGFNAASETMVELFAEDMIPMAILHSAAVMKMFLDEAYSLESIEEEVDKDTYDPPPKPGCSSFPVSILSLFPLSYFAIIALWSRRRNQK